MKKNIFTILADEAKDMKEKGLKNLWWNRPWIWVVTLFFVACVLNCIDVMSMPNGGYATFLGMLPLWLITYFFGWKRGLVASLLFAIPKFFITAGVETLKYAESIGVRIRLRDFNHAVFGGGYIDFFFVQNDGPKPLDGLSNAHALQFLCVFILEYVLACGLFFVGGFIKRGSSLSSREIGLSRNVDYEANNFQLKMGYTIGMLLMFVCYVTSALLFYHANGEDGSIWHMSSLFFWESVVYDAGYLFIEYLLTMIILAIPGVSDAIHFMKYVTNNVKEDMTLYSY